MGMLLLCATATDYGFVQFSDWISFYYVRHLCVIYQDVSNVWTIMNKEKRFDCIYIQFLVKIELF